jgi:hypothetical protein
MFITGCKFTRNTAVHIGGATCAISDASGLITHSTFTENSVTNAARKGQGGALFYRTIASDSFPVPLELRYCTFSGIIAVHAGGAFYALLKVNVTIVSSIFRNNSATAGGAISFHRNDPWPDILLSLISCIFFDNTAVVRSRNRVGLPSVYQKKVLVVH